jgi:hypothetical protein
MKIILETSYRDVELMETPGLAVADMTPELIQRIYRFQRAVKHLECYEITEFNYMCEFTQWAENEKDGKTIPGEELRTECNILHVGDVYFKWVCYVKHTDVELVTEETAIDILPNPYDEEL